MKTDSQLQKDVMEELSWEPMLNACEIGVSVRNGVVTLDGYVDSYAQKLAAERATKRIKDVRAVAEEIEVRIPSGRRKTDNEIAEVALFALEWDTAVPDQDIRLKVENGWLTLDGRVDYQFQKEAAFDAVRQLKGVKGVVNLLLVRPGVVEVQDNLVIEP